MAENNGETSKKSGIQGGITSVWKNHIARNIYAMDFSYNFIVSVVELLLQYQMALVFLSSATYTAANAYIVGTAAITSFLVSVFVAPLLNRTLSYKQRGFLLPVGLAIFSCLFLALVFAPQVFTYFFTAIGFPGVDILFLSCVVGAGVDIVKNTTKYSIADVYTSKLWKIVDNENPEVKIQETSNFLSGKPAKACSAAFIILLEGLSSWMNMSMLWIAAPVLMGFFVVWFYALRRANHYLPQDTVSAQYTATKRPEETSNWLMYSVAFAILFMGVSSWMNASMLWVAAPALLGVWMVWWLKPVQNTVPNKSSSEQGEWFFTHIQKPDFWHIASISVLFGLGTTLLLMLKNTVIVASAGVQALPYLKVMILLVIPVASMSMNYIEKLYDEKALYVFLLCANAFFIIFAALYPYADFLHAFCFTCGLLPPGLSGVVQFGLFSLFYIVVEVWSSATMDRIYKPLQNKSLKEEQLGTYIPSIAAVYCIAQIIATGVTVFTSTLPVYTIILTATAISVLSSSAIAVIYRNHFEDIARVGSGSKACPSEQMPSSDRPYAGLGTDHSKQSDPQEDVNRMEFC